MTTQNQDKKTQKKSFAEEQKKLFKALDKKNEQSKIFQPGVLQDIVQEVLNKGEHSAYRLMNGETELSAWELKTICRRFHISADELLDLHPDTNAVFRYLPIDLSAQNHVKFLEWRAETYDRLQKDGETEFFFSAHDVPMCYGCNYPELVLFRLFVCNSVLRHTDISYDSFCKNPDSDRIIALWKQACTKALRIPSTEIWSIQTIDTMLGRFIFSYNIRAFERRDTAQFLLTQLKNLMNDIRRDAKNGYRDDCNTPFRMYVCSICPESNILLAKSKNNPYCAIRPYLNKIFETHDPAVCNEIQKWIDDLIAKSTLISGGNSVECEIDFFTAIQEKIDRLIEIITSGTKKIPIF